MPNRTKTMRFHLSPFTGKEKDEETGYGYFDARYMDYELMTGWLSVDPMLDEYPNVSPYHYCHWNPIVKIDLDGRNDDNYLIFENGRIFKEETSDNTNTYTFVRSDLSEVDLETYEVCTNNNGEDMVSIGHESSGATSMFTWLGINSGNLFFEEDAFAAFLGGLQCFYDSHSSPNPQPVRINQLMSYDRCHSDKPNRHSAMDIAYYSTAGKPGAHVDKPNDHASIALNSSLVKSLRLYGLGSNGVFTSIDVQGNNAFLDGTTAKPGHHTHMHLQGFRGKVYPTPQIIEMK